MAKPYVILKKEIQGVKSRDLGGHVIGPPLPIQQLGKVSCRVLRTSLYQWSGTHLAENGRQALGVGFEVRRTAPTYLGTWYQ